MEKVILIILAVAAAATPGHAAMGQILASWPAPTSTFNRVNGLACGGEYIWVKDRACESGGVVKCTGSGSVINEIGFPWHGWNDSYGLAFDGAYLWTIHHQPQYPYADNYVKYTTTGSEVTYFVKHPSPPYKNSVSVSWDGQYLWTEETLRNNPVYAGKYTTTGSLVGSYAISQNWGTAAGYYNHQLWAGSGAYIYGMNIAGGLVASFAAPGGSVRAVGFDGDYLWTADANTPQYIYKVDIDVVDVEPASVGRVKALFR